jgi:FtsP/CotA-like multicopper oxidase with cupredoxin domain
MAATVLSMLLVPLGASAQDSSIVVQCPPSTELHPTGDGIKCDHLSAGDGMVTMADDQEKQLYIFGFSKLALPGVDGAPAAGSGLYSGWVMDNGTLAANAPAPTISVDEDDEYFLSLTNVGMAMRPDLFDPHTIHWHGFPEASSVFDGVPDASISIAGGATLSYYYLAKDAGTYMYHCHVEATEHMQMGMLGNLFVRPRQNKLAEGADLSTEFATNAANVINGGSVPAPITDNGAVHLSTNMYAYNDGDGTTRYDVEYPIQIGSFDSDFHDASFNVQPLPFAAMRDTYFLLNGRGYPDTANATVLSTVDPLDREQASQPVHSLISAAPGQRILLRISNLNVTTFSTLGTSGLPMQVVALDARLLRDDDGNNMYYKTNSLTLGGGQSADVIITAPATPGTTYFLYSKNLDQLSNNEENFGGMMTEIRIN